MEKTGGELPTGGVASDLTRILEPSARAIAAKKRGVSPNHPEIDRIWPTYVGQARACIIAFLDMSARSVK